MFDANAPASSSVTVSMPVTSMFTGWEAREGHFMCVYFFGAKEGDLVTFTSTAIEITGDDTAKITDALTMNGVTKSVVLDAVFLTRLMRARSPTSLGWALMRQPHYCVLI